VERKPKSLPDAQISDHDVVSYPQGQDSVPLEVVGLVLKGGLCIPIERVVERGCYSGIAIEARLEPRNGLCQPSCVQLRPKEEAPRIAECAALRSSLPGGGLLDTDHCEVVELGLLALALGVGDQTQAQGRIA